ncbi:MAG TPA: hypothetical protein VGQ06_06490 [Gemmatimonadales bacterium]|jgi:hypothetical protein|nr:hypothetical protein [Gemmatimonadales bacterium]
MRRIGMTVLSLALCAASLAAQRSALREVRNRGYAGINLVVAQPLDDFRRTGGVSAGLTGFAVMPLGRSARMGLRIDGSYMVYESDYRGYGISTTSSIGSLALGPQITLGEGPIRPYAFATLGGSLFWTSLSDQGYCGCYDDDVFYLNGRFTTATQLGTGVMMVLSRGHTPVSLDLGVRDLRHAQVRYVPVGGITDNGDGTYTVDRVETPVRMRVYQIGVSVGIR